MTDLKIFARNVDEKLLNQITEISSSKAFEGQRIRIMPDSHVGVGVCIGFTSTLGGFINPEHTGEDIGCSVTALKLDNPILPKDYPAFERLVRKIIPIGKGNINEKVEYSEKDLYKFLTSEYLKVQSRFPEIVFHIDRIDEKWILDFCKRIGLGEKDFYKSIGSIGSGNHYIEYGESDNQEDCYISFHTGSRVVGSRVCSKWSGISKKFSQKTKLEELIRDIKAEEPDRKAWKAKIEEATDWVKKNIPTSYLIDDAAKGYYSDMVVAQSYSKFNHLEITRRLNSILNNRFNIKIESEIRSVHNYIDFEDMIIRKGAISARKDQICIIPFNMRDGFGIFRGLGNLDWNNSAPHGAGRRLSRMKAFETLDIEDFKESMKDVYSTSVIPEVLDESPMAYKDPNEILDQIEGETVELLNIIRPKINIKDNGTRIRKSRRETKI